jgi:hypothetical protein
MHARHNLSDASIEKLKDAVAAYLRDLSQDF